VVDTKYEFVKLKMEIVLIDEIHTPDSSRISIQKDIKRQDKGEEQKQSIKGVCLSLVDSKWFQGLEGQQILMTDEYVETVSRGILNCMSKSWEKICESGFPP
jgi:phosphoribosylaminoimidazole-succinocarboxamide synthase